MADRTLAKSLPVSAHPYLERKSVQAHGSVREYCGKLVLPLRDAAGTVHSLQFVSGDGTKRFLSGGRCAGTYFELSAQQDGPLFIREGYATGASIFEATGRAVVCAMNAGNLLAVAKALRERWPEREIIIAADNDRATAGNPGLTKSTEAAKAIGAKLAVPEFDGATGTDFNDLATAKGLNAADSIHEKLLDQNLGQVRNNLPPDVLKDLPPSRGAID